MPVSPNYSKFLKATDFTAAFAVGDIITYSFINVLNIGSRHFGQWHIYFILLQTLFFGSQNTLFKFIPTHVSRQRYSRQRLPLRSRKQNFSSNFITVLKPDAKETLNKRSITCGGGGGG